MKISKSKIKSLRQILYNRIKDGGDIRISITAYKQGDDNGLKIFEKADIKSLININEMLDYEKFIRTRIEVFDFNKDKINPERIFDYTDDSRDFSGSSGFSGFGNMQDFGQNQMKELVKAEANSLFSAYTQEWERQRLQEENLQLKKNIKKLEDNIEELENDVDSAEEAIDQYQEKMKSQQNWKTYAGLAGIALNKMGLKDSVSEALSGFIGDDDDDKNESSKKSTEDNNTRIIDEPRLCGEEEPKNEYIALIDLCLKSMNNKVLGAVFSLLSEIEKNNTLVFQLLVVIEKHKAKINEQNQKKQEEKNQENTQNQNLQTQNLTNDENIN